jgi:hypothetical protein
MVGGLMPDTTGKSLKSALDVVSPKRNRITGD